MIAKIAVDKAAFGFDRLFDYVSQPRYDGIKVEAVHGQTTITYDAYISSGERKVVRIDTENEVVYYDTFDLNIVPILLVSLLPCSTTARPNSLPSISRTTVVEPGEVPFLIAILSASISIHSVLFSSGRTASFPASPITAVVA